MSLQRYVLHTHEKTDELTTLLQYLNDSTLKNVHWALCTGVFGKRDIGRIEREYLDVLDFELGVTEDDILSNHQGLMSIALGISRSHPEKAHSRAVDSHHLEVPTSTRNHRRRTPVPELEPSSPESSSTSSYSSPQTPSSTESSPAHEPQQKSTIQPSHPKKSVSTTTMEILRSFPLPIPGTSHQSRSWRQSQFPIHL